MQIPWKDKHNRIANKLEILNLHRDSTTYYKLLIILG